MGFNQNKKWLAQRKSKECKKKAGLRNQNLDQALYIFIRIILYIKGK